MGLLRMSMKIKAAFLSADYFVSCPLMPLRSQHPTGGELKQRDPELSLSHGGLLTKTTWEHPQACWNEGGEILGNLLLGYEICSDEVPDQLISQETFAPIACRTAVQEAGRNQKGGLRNPFLCSLLHHRVSWVERDLQGSSPTPTHALNRGVKHKQLCRTQTGRRWDGGWQDKCECGSKALRGWFTLWNAGKRTEFHHSHFSWVLHSQKPHSPPWIRSCWLHTPQPLAAPCHETLPGAPDQAPGMDTQLSPGTGTVDRMCPFPQLGCRWLSSPHIQLPACWPHSKASQLPGITKCHTRQSAPGCEHRASYIPTDRALQVYQPRKLLNLPLVP